MASLLRRFANLSLRSSVRSCIPTLPQKIGMNQFNLVVTRGMANHYHKKIVKLAKGYRGRAKSCYSVAYHRVLKARQYNYRHRKMRKRDFNKLWLQRINAASRMHGVPYSLLKYKMVKQRMFLNRKVMAELAVYEPLTFKAIVEVANQADGPPRGRYPKFKKFW